MTGDLTATLKEIRECSETASRIECSWKAQLQRARASANDVPRLLAALRAVLELADEATLETIDASGAAHSWDLDPAKIREAISRELKGENDDQ